MFKKILNTILSRFAIAFLNVIIVLVTAKYLGASGRGYYSWWILNLTFINHITGFIGGASLVYFIPRFNVKLVVAGSYAWSFLVSLLVSFALYSLHKLNPEESLHFFILSLLESTISTYLFIVLGVNNIKKFNFLQFLNTFIFLISFVAGLVFSVQNNYLIIYALYVSKIATILFSVVYVHKILSISHHPELHLKPLLEKSSVNQFGNIFQFINYRISFYFLEWVGKSNLAMLGVFSTAMSIAEGIWLVNKSISTVHYANVSNTSDIQKNINTTIHLFKITFLTIFLLTLLLVLIPASFYSYFLNKDFDEIKPIILILSPGILMFSLSGIISHFFSGIGHMKYNLYSCLISAIITSLVAYCLIPAYTIIGAALTNVISYLLNVFLLIFIFKVKFKVPLQKLMLNKKDITELYSLLKSKTGK